MQPHGARSLNPSAQSNAYITPLNPFLPLHPSSRLFSPLPSRQVPSAIFHEPKVCLPLSLLSLSHPSHSSLARFWSFVSLCSFFFFQVSSACLPPNFCLSTLRPRPRPTWTPWTPLFPTWKTVASSISSTLPSLLLPSSSLLVVSAVSQ